MTISDCCGAEPRGSDIPWTDIGICPDCRDHCEYIEEDDEITFTDGTPIMVNQHTGIIDLDPVNKLLSDEREYK